MIGHQDVEVPEWQKPAGRRSPGGGFDPRLVPALLLAAVEGIFREPVDVSHNR